MTLILRYIFFALLFLKARAAIDFEDVSIFNYHLSTGVPAGARMMMDEAKDLLLSNLNYIVGGDITDISHVPYQAGLIIRVLHSFTSVCGGSLISKTRVITAAHCNYDGRTSAQEITVVLGSNRLFTGGMRYDSEGIVVHSNWDPSTTENDIAIVFIPSVTFTDVIKPISLPKGSELKQNFMGWIALASGYGLTKDRERIQYNQKLSSVEVPIIPNERCSHVYGDIVRDTNICADAADGHGTCQGDSGGPLTVLSNGRRVLIGITSFGARAGCEKGYPDAFTRVTSYVPWIISLRRHLNTHDT